MSSSEMEAAERRAKFRVYMANRRASIKAGTWKPLKRGKGARVPEGMPKPLTSLADTLAQAGNHE